MLAWSEKWLDAGIDGNSNGKWFWDRANLIPPFFFLPHIRAKIACKGARYKNP
jgi:hypothetical protein